MTTILNPYKFQFPPTLHDQHTLPIFHQSSMASFKLNLPFNGQMPVMIQSDPTHNAPMTHISTPNNFPPCSLKSDRLSSVVCNASSTLTKPKEKPKDPICDRWREIHGRDNWASLLDPMDPLLRTEIMRYAQMAQACYDGFNNDAYSKYCGTCKFPPKTFFQELGMSDSGYEITSYLYTSNTSNLIPRFFTKSLQPDGPWNPMVNWMGFVAVSDDETTARIGRRDITIAWRGTVTKLEWLDDLISFLKPASAQDLASPDPSIKVMAGFLHVYTDKDQSCPYSQFSAHEQVLAEISRLLEIYKQKGEDISITITGHSLGSALAILSAYDIAESGMKVHEKLHEIPISVFSFSGPRVGNTRFKKRLEELGVKVLRVFNTRDVVKDVPGVVLNETIPGWVQLFAEWTTLLYSHVGEVLGLDHTISPYIKEKCDPASMHNLELLMHLLDGYHGKGMDYSETIGRDKALLNKDGDLLKEEFLLPPNWSQVENKGLYKNENGEWVLPSQNGIEDHLRPEDIQAHLRKLGLI